MLAARLATSHTLHARATQPPRRAPLFSRVDLCPPARRCRRLERRRPARAPAPRTSAALQLVALPALATVSKALLLGVAASWAHATAKQWWAAMEELFHFSPHRLRLQYLPGTGETGPIEARRYTLTHSDHTGELQLSIGRDWHEPQLSGWYKRLMRDEVLAEWRATGIIAASAGLGRTASGSLCSHPPSSPCSGDSFGAPTSSPGSGLRRQGSLELPHLPSLPSLHIYCHVSVHTALEVAGAVARIPWPPAPARLRAFIFQKDMPLVLAALAYAERRLLQSAPMLAAAPVYVHLKSHLPELDRVVPWGRFGDPASWVPQAPAPAPAPTADP